MVQTNSDPQILQIASPLKPPEQQECSVGAGINHAKRRNSVLTASLRKYLNPDIFIDVYKIRDKRLLRFWGLN